MNERETRNIKEREAMIETREKREKKLREK